MLHYSISFAILVVQALVLAIFSLIKTKLKLENFCASSEWSRRQNLAPLFPQKFLRTREKHQRYVKSKIRKTAFLSRVQRKLHKSNFSSYTYTIVA